MGTATKVKKGQVLNYDYTGGVQSITLPPGSYKLECWGAQGGYRLNDISTYGGKGGYSVGELTLNEETTLYVQVGGSGNTGIYNGGYNGGGKRKTYNGGGGGTDIRIGQDSLFARVIVAGGGGSDGANNKQGMYGGGESGGSSTENYGTGGGGGTQTAGGAGGSGNNNSGTFGAGGEGLSTFSGHGGAGGGGWYGGGGAYPDSSGDDDRGGGGGSGYVYTADTATNYPSGCLLSSKYYLTDAQTIAGNTSFPSPNGGTETGHEGNGYARITVLAVEPSISASVKVGGQWHQANEMFVKVNGVWKECIEAWMKVNGVWKSPGKSTPSTPTTYTITLGSNVDAITANGKIPQRDKLSYYVSEGDTIVVASTTFNANSYSMVFSHIPANVSFSKKTNNGTGARAKTSVTFTMPASDLTVSFTLKSGAGA